MNNRINVGDQLKNVRTTKNTAHGEEDVVKDVQNQILLILNNYLMHNSLTAQQKQVE